MKYFLLLLVLFSTNILAQSIFYRFDSHHGPFKPEYSNYFTQVFNEGRMQIFKIRQNYSRLNIPNEIFKQFEKIESNSWKVIKPYKLTKKVKPNSKILTLINEISEENINLHLEFMSTKLSRRSGAPGNQETVTYIDSLLTKNNFKTTKHCFSPGLCNIWGVINGEIDEYVLIEAHLDSVGKSYAGADDNASGTASLLELSRLLSKNKYKRGLIIFATNGEESGLLGSKTFVEEAEKSGLLSKISFVINMDMIGWNKNGIVDIETDRGFEDYAKWMSALVNTYTNLLPEITMPAWGSDHVPFLRKKIPSILTIEHWKTKTPCYHKSCDTLDTLNIPYLMEITKLNLAASIYKLQE
ncbi:MAG: M28 family peptidase [Bdellovibrionales bacterium]|jgi:hypothetical protein|nr:M28 family peptidase [Bdellovibrionales bacterium]